MNWTNAIWETARLRWLNLVAAFVGAAIIGAAWWTGASSWPGSLTCSQWMQDTRPQGSEHLADMTRYLSGVELATEMADAPDLRTFVADLEAYCDRHPADSLQAAIATTYASAEYNGEGPTTVGANR